MAVEISLLWLCLDWRGLQRNWPAAINFFSVSLHPYRWLLFGGSLLFTLASLFRDLKHRVTIARPSNARVLLAIHFAAFCSFAALLNIVPQLELSLSPRGALPVLALVAAGLAWLGFWLLSFIPLAPLVPLQKRAGLTFVISLAVSWALLGLRLTEQAWNGVLGKWAMWQVYYSLHVFSPTPTVDADHRVVGMSGFQVMIADSCSGSQGIGLIWIFLGGYLWLSRKNLRFPQAFILLPIATLIMWAFNTVRIVALICLGAWYAPEVAVEGFHSHAGWLILISVSLALVYITTRWRFFASESYLKDQARLRTAPTAGPADVNPTAVFLTPFLALTASMMITRAFSSGFDVLYPLRVVATLLAVWMFRREFQALTWRCSWFGVVIGVFAFGLWLGLEPLVAKEDLSPPPQSVFEALSPELAIFWLVFRCVGSVVTVPFAEELAFRGFLLRRLISADFCEVPTGKFTWLSLLVSSAAFGALHGERWLAGFLVGILFAVSQYRRGQLADAIVAHATTNALLSGYVLATGSWELW